MIKLKFHEVDLMKNISSNLSENKKYIKYVLGESPDIILREFMIPALNNSESFFLCVDGMVNSNEIDNTILEALVKYRGVYKEDNQSGGKKQEDAGSGNKNRQSNESNNGQKDGQDEKNTDSGKSSNKKGSGGSNEVSEAQCSGEGQGGSAGSEDTGNSGSSKSDGNKENGEEDKESSDNGQKGKNSDEGIEDSKDGQVSDKINFLTKQGVLVPSLKTSNNWNEILDAVLSGDTALFLEGESMAVILSTRGWAQRSVSTPTVEDEVRASKDAFNENMRTNTSLIRRRIRDYSLRIESMKIGERTKTDIS
ncbi:MAG: spore germination protein, partial [Bacillota bacterium]|nr:spore germination protein [Bacillota bacterium]